MRTLLLPLCLLFALPATAQDWAGANRGGGSAYDGGHGVAVDADGNVFVTGYIEGESPFDYNVFVAKHSPEGHVLWTRTEGGSGYDRANGVAVDASGNAYVTGVFAGTATFGPFILTSIGFGGTFLVKYSPDGDVLWAKSGGGPGSTFALGVSVDAAGNAYVSGSFLETATFEPFSLTAVGASDTFLVKYSPDGDPLWAESGGGTGTDDIYGMTVSPTGFIYVTGTFESPTIAFGPFSFPNAGSDDLFLVKYSLDGDVLWARADGGAGSEAGNGIGVDAAGNAYVTGQYGGTATLGPFTLQSVGSEDLFLVKYSADGVPLWARSSGGATSNYVSGIAVDATGHSYVTGHFRRWAAFGPVTLVRACASGVFLVKYSPDGDPLWAESGSSTSGTRDIYSLGIALDGGGGAYITGRFHERADFGRTTLTSVGGDDVFVAKFDMELPAPLTAAPVAPPVVIPSAGGSFDFTATLTNPTSAAQTFEVWSAAIGPDSTHRRALPPQVVTLPAGASEVLTFTQAVPPGAPAGTWIYEVRAGTSPCHAVADDGFTFIKEAAGHTELSEGEDVEGWHVAGWEETEVAVSLAVGGLPSGYAISAARPNPFTSQTQLTLELAAAQHVRAEVFDSLGRRVAVLHDGPLASGAEHRLTLDGSDLPAGFYLVRAVGETFADTRVLTLMR